MPKTTILITYLLLLQSFYSKSQNVLILEQKQPLPIGSVLLGTVKNWGGGPKANCSYNAVIDDAKSQAIEMGGNIVKITTLKEPDVWNLCYRLKAEVYFAKQLSAGGMDARYDDSIHKSLIPDSADYSILYVYRLDNMMGINVDYDLCDENGTILCNVKNNSVNKLKIYKKGQSVLTAKNEVKRSVTLNIEFGKIYFLRCSVSMGVIAGRPNLEEVHARIGLAEVMYMGRTEPASNNTR